MVRKRKSHYNTISPRGTLTPSSPSNKSSRACLSSALDRSFICWIWCLAVAKTDSTFLQFYFYIKTQWLSIFFHWNTQVSKNDLKSSNMSLNWILFTNILGTYIKCDLFWGTFFFLEFKLWGVRIVEIYATHCLNLFI